MSDLPLSMRHDPASSWWESWSLINPLMRLEHRVPGLTITDQPQQNRMGNFQSLMSNGSGGSGPCVSVRDLKHWNCITINLLRSILFVDLFHFKLLLCQVMMFQCHLSASLPPSSSEPEPEPVCVKLMPWTHQTWGNNLSKCRQNMWIILKLRLWLSKSQQWSSNLFYSWQFSTLCSRVELIH